MLRIFETVRYLRPGQLLHRTAHGLARWGVVALEGRARATAAPGARFLPRSSSQVSRGRVRHLNQERAVPPGLMGSLQQPLLWTYHFHYHDALLAPSPTESEKADWVATWLRHVPPGSRPAWDPYPLSRRIPNWIKWHLTTDVPPPEGFLDSLATQAGYLRGHFEYHLLANHLLANATALTMAGAFFGGKEGDGWLKYGSKVLARELDEQFLADGAHYELSPAYHALIVEDLLDLIQVSRLTGVAIPAAVEACARRGCAWLAWITRPDGRVPLFNDAAYGVASETAAVLGYAERLGVAHEPIPHGGLHVSEPSGYFRYDRGRLAVLGDVGEIGPSYQPGHAHCDMHSFELCWEGSPVIVDTGVSTYEVGELRMRERGSGAHNNVQLGDLDQSEIWASFRVARRARIEERCWDDAGVRCRIRAFPPLWATLERTFGFEGESVRVTDRVAARPRHPAPQVARLHFHPDVLLRQDGEGWTANGLRVSFDGATAVRVVDYEYAPEFNLRIPARCLEAAFAGELVTEIGPA